MNRRDFLKAVGVLGASSAIPFWVYENYIKYNFDKKIYYPGMEMGHKFRDGKLESKDYLNKETDTIIVGSGIAALTAAYKLVKEKHKGTITLVSGPELFGNSNGININNQVYPTGAHYLPLQSEDSNHVREILYDLNIITNNPYGIKPTYNEKDLVMSPMERFLENDEWIEGNHPHSEHFEAFVTLINQYKFKKDKNGSYLFTFPIEKCSNELNYLDKILFSDWLKENNIVDKDLLHYINYCVRDDYGVSINQCSAFAGILYFAGRNGQAENANTDSVMTWTDGNHHLASLLLNKIKDKVEVIPYTVTNISNHIVTATNSLNNYKIKAKHIIISVPLFITNRILTDYKIEQSLIPRYSSWIIGNYLFDTLPKERFKGCGLAYDNVLNNSENLGYVYSANQSLNISRENKVITTYTNIPTKDFKETRKLLQSLSTDDLLDISLKDIINSYGRESLYNIKEAHVTIRGHAMSFPEVGFLEKNSSIKKLNESLNKDNIYLAHSDMSRISTFEEASYHGYNAALNVLGKSI